MQQNAVVLILSLVVSLGAATQAAAQAGLEFTLDEVDAESAKPAKSAAAVPVDSTQAIAEALGELHWGMSKDELLKLLKKQIHAEFEQRIKVERDVMRQDALYQEAQDRYRRIHENFVTFDGQKSGWDVSPVANEFTHGNGEAMLVVANKHSRDLYFFMHGKLWKWYRELAPDAPEIADSRDAMMAFRARFGRGKSQQDRLDETKLAYTGVTWSDASTRVTALERGNDTCLIFEDVRVVPQLVVLRRNAQPKTEKARAALAVESVLLR